jgi:hypothetical protein
MQAMMFMIEDWAHTQSSSLLNMDEKEC